MSSTGIRDTASVSILNSLVELGKKLRKRVPGSQKQSEAEVTAVLRKEFEDLLQGGKLDDVINPLLGMDGQFTSLMLKFSLYSQQVSMFIWIHQQKSCIRSYLGLSNTFGHRQFFYLKRLIFYVSFKAAWNPSTRTASMHHASMRTTYAIIRAV